METPLWRSSHPVNLIVLYHYMLLQNVKPDVVLKNLAGIKLAFFLDAPSLLSVLTSAQQQLSGQPPNALSLPNKLIISVAQELDNHQELIEFRHIISQLKPDLNNLLQNCQLSTNFEVFRAFVCFVSDTHPFKYFCLMPQPLLDATCYASLLLTFTEAQGELVILQILQCIESLQVPAELQKYLLLPLKVCRDRFRNVDIIAQLAAKCLNKLKITEL